MSNELIEALKQILGWRELRSGNEIPIERIEEIARDAIANAALQPSLPQEIQVPIAWAQPKDIRAAMIATVGERAEVAPDKEPGFTVPLYLRHDATIDL